MANNEAIVKDIAIRVFSESSAIESIDSHAAEVKKKPLTRQRSLSGGCRPCEPLEDTNFHEKRIQSFMNP